MHNLFGSFQEEDKYLVLDLDKILDLEEQYEVASSAVHYELPSAKILRIGKLDLDFEVIFMDLKSNASNIVYRCSVGGSDASLCQSLKIDTNVAVRGALVKSDEMYLVLTSLQLLEPAKSTGSRKKKKKKVTSPAPSLAHF